MQKACKHCGEGFDITDADLAFYDKVSPTFSGTKFPIPSPTFCPQCRLQRKLAWRKTRKLYRDECDLCKKQMLSLYAPDSPYTVYCSECWWSDKWDPMTYGRDMDFSKSFFDQFRDLQITVPKMAIIDLGNLQNSEFTNDVQRLKNCYLVFDGEQGQDCYYGESFLRVKDCCDFHHVYDCEGCYEILNCFKCYELRHSRFCINCSSSSFLMDCHGCKDCLGCCNIQEKQYCIFNEQLTKDEYSKKLAGYKLHTQEGLTAFRAQAEKFFLTQPKRAYRGVPNDNVTGDNLISCKDSFDCFDSMNLRDCRYMTHFQLGATDSYDVNGWGGKTQLVYDSVNIGEGASEILFSFFVTHNVSSIFYSVFCSRGCANLFGCDELRAKKYCILNKQYSPDEYEALVAKIITHMQKTEEWGEFFPTGYSTFAYNETLAQEYYPLTKSQVQKKNLLWRDETDNVGTVTKTIPAERLPAEVAAIPDDVLNWALKCSASGKFFRLTKQELDFYRSRNLPAPRLHPDERHRERLKLRNPRKLWVRQCAKCAKSMHTTYSPDRPEIVYCEECFRTEVF